VTNAEAGRRARGDERVRPRRGDKRGGGVTNAEAGRRARGDERKKAVGTWAKAPRASAGVTSAGAGVTSASA
jgi:hypothetical protein